MAQQATENTKFKFESADFPIFYDDGLLRVYKNPSNEIFVEDVQSGAEMRISSSARCDGLRFTTDERVEPVQVGGRIGWRVSRR